MSFAYDHIFTDLEIADLIAEPKPLPYDWRSISPVTGEGITRVQTVEIEGKNGNIFVLKLSQNRKYLTKFCLLIALKRKGTSKLFHLRRYDGKHGQHTNSIEKTKFYNFHVHIATERYQKYGSGEEDKYAEETDRFTDYEGALSCLLKDCNFKIANNPQLDIFGGM